ncbi:MAG: peptidoglycan binding domain-containing protein [Nocardiaceae bacterium]|nr:peptidoglycan binding domain-containing protein [Nocardiaceae bacterium]
MPPPPPRRIIPEIKVPIPRPSRVAMITAGAFVAAGALYSLDLALTTGEIPRGVEVAGIDVGGLDAQQVDAVLRHDLDRKLEESHKIIAGEVDTNFVPSRAGLGVNYELTIAGLPKQSWNPITRFASYFTTTEGNLVTTVNESKLNKAMDKIKGVAQRDKVEGSVRIKDGRVVPIYPLNGQNLEEDQARTALIDGWAEDAPIRLPVHVDPTGVTQDAVNFAINGIANPAATSDVSFKGKDGEKATLEKSDIGSVLRFEPDGGGGLKPVYDYDAAVKILAPQLASTDVQATEATFISTGSGVQVTKSAEGEIVDWPKTLDQLPDLLQQTIGTREADAIYKKVQPKLTQQQANDLGIREVIGEFNIGKLDWWSGVNIRTAGSLLNGTVIKPG